MPTRSRSRSDSFVSLLVDYAKADETTAPAPTPELVIPSDLSTLSTDELLTLHEQAVSEFDALYADGKGLSPEEMDTLNDLATAIESVSTEVRAREEAQDERDSAAAELANRVRPSEAVEDTAAVEDSDAQVEDTESAAAESEEPESIAASGGRGDIRVNLAGARARRSRRDVPRNHDEPARTMQDVVFAADVPGFTAGEGLDWNGIGRAVDRRLTSFNASQYASAAAAGRHVREQNGIAVIRKPFDPKLVIRNSDPDHVAEVMRYATDESRLPGGSLVASGGWCAPSTTLYDLFELETREGLFSLPEVGVSRGGIKWTVGPDYSTIYANTPGWNVTEAEDIAGDYTPGAGTGGTKPCFHVDCPTWQEKRLNAEGLCITAGLLQQRGFPEYIARTVRGALIAHDHRNAKLILDELIAGSTAVTMTPDQVGATAPLLDAIEIQVQHYRYIHRMNQNSTLEGVFPYWVHGAVRSDLARRLGVDLIDVPNARIDGWFRDRGVSPQFVYNFQDLTGTADAAVHWPTTVSFLLYAAGTWVKGGSDVITLDTIYDSVLLGTNDYTALWTEEGWLTAKMGHDSRYVTVQITPSGMTGQGVVIDYDGTQGTAPVVLGAGAAPQSKSK